jgi:lipoate-protein ligase A
MDDYVSGSAFKLVNARAYHHGTMLIDAKLGDLRGVLGNDQVSTVSAFRILHLSFSSIFVIDSSCEYFHDQNKMIAKGVASVSSAVRNLRDWSTTIDHEEFVEAVVDEFTRTYGGDGLVKVRSSFLSHRYAAHTDEVGRDRG